MAVPPLVPRKKKRKKEIHPLPRLGMYWRLQAPIPFYRPVIALVEFPPEEGTSPRHEPAGRASVAVH